MALKQKLLSFILNYLHDKDNFVLLWNGKKDKDNLKTYIFTDPIKVINCFTEKKLKDSLFRLEQNISKGYYAAGFLSYETGLIFENISATDYKNSQSPLMWFGIYNKPIIFDHRKGKFEKDRTLNQNLKNFELTDKFNYKIQKLKPDLKKQKYKKNINSIKKFIEEGETYQVNYTFKHKFKFTGNPSALFFHLCMKQSASYTALIKCLDKTILSLSPELFFKRSKNKITVKPMKGTVSRGKNNIEDENNKNWLHNSIKNKAENIMIVDLLRNDLGKISEIGSVKVNTLFEVEKYETLYQMISTVESKLKPSISWTEIFKNIFPSGSVTGAPKINTMKIIKKIEKDPRKIYTGSIGYISPTNESVFNVAIRTILLDTKNNKGEMGIGSGIVYDSDAEDEYKECLLKSRFLTDKYREFSLIETLLWENGKYFLINLHLKRLKESAEYFAFKYNKKKIINQLNIKCEKFKPNRKYKVRLLLDKNDKITITSSELNNSNKNSGEIVFSDKKINSENLFLYHKTTNRKLYNDELKKARKKGFFDILFTNKRNEITEGSITNLVIKKNGKFYTPDLKSGVLNGVYRQYLFEKKDFSIYEKKIYKNDFFDADEVYLINSVRKMLKISR